MLDIEAKEVLTMLLCLAAIPAAFLWLFIMCLLADSSYKDGWILAILRLPFTLGIALAEACTFIIFRFRSPNRT